ncbi:uncharacterized protein QYS62_001661 [Fusarium acuminatum]|uniref:Uncharacterized protein n=1 Tax=Fusarium acuminatum TaxID=5515 RepID=A0ABZ2WJB8_9HYPO
MQFTTIFSTVAFATGAYAWAQSGNGEWIANNELYGIMPYSGGAIKVWEACTFHGSNALVPAGYGCRYWTNAQGGIFSGSKYFSFVSG